jgi:hypothetical protein
MRSVSSPFHASRDFTATPQATECLPGKSLNSIAAMSWRRPFSKPAFGMETAKLPASFAQLANLYDKDEP